MGQFVSFKAVKAAVTMEMVLQHYGITRLKRRGDELRGPCPIHRGEGLEAFHVNTVKQCFHCFSCGAYGNVIDFCAAMEQCPAREAALKLQSWLPAISRSQSQENNIPAQATALTPVQAFNQPLRFELKNIDYGHPYLKQRGISEETARHFGVGYCRKGSLAGRVTIPIHNESGELLAYAGRAIDGAEPRYKLPAGFHKSLELYNLHRAAKCGPDEVFLVEGFFDAMRLHQAGFPNVVAAMGCSLAKAQCKLLSKHFGHVSVMFDADDSGIDGSMDAVIHLAHDVYVTVVCLPPDMKQPDEMAEEELGEWLRGNASRCHSPHRPFFGTQRVQ